MKKFFSTTTSTAGLKNLAASVPGSILFLLAFILFGMMPSAQAQQFVKTYKAIGNCSQMTGNLIFNCITKSKKTPVTFYIAGVQDKAVYIAEVDANGAVMQEKLVGVNSSTYSLRSMITDEDGNIVIVGSMDFSASSTTTVRSYLMKVSPALSLLLHRTYSLRDQVYMLDVKDNKKSGQYYVCGGSRKPNNAADVLLMKVDRNTGAITLVKNGNAGEDGYDALVFAPGTVDSSSNIIATGRLSHIGTPTMRPWNNIHDPNLLFVKGQRYIVQEGGNARLYSSSLVNDGQNILHCWQGSLNNTGLIGVNTGLSSFDASTLSPNWQNEYFLTPAAQTYKFFNKVDTDPNGYVAEGNWWNGASRSTIDNGALGEMFLLRTDKTGTPIWSRKVINVFVNQATHNAAFVTDGNSIYAVGFKQGGTASLNAGALVRIPLSTGAMDTSCATLQVWKVKEYTFKTPDSIGNVDVTLGEATNYHPINCTQTERLTSCDMPCNDSVMLNADFDLTGFIPQGNPANYTVSASNFTGGSSSQWIVSRTSSIAPYPDVATSIYASSPGGLWGNAATTSFGGYMGTNFCTESTGIGSFAVNNRYRIKHILSATNNCGITTTATMVKTIFMCTNCRSNGGVIVETEPAFANASHLSKEQEMTAASENNTLIKVMPNPANGSVITIESAAALKSPLQISIADMQGKKVAATQFNNSLKTNRYSMDISTLSNGIYTVSVTGNGKTTTQKLVVAK